MKEITLFYLETCPYCRQASRAMRELEEENPRYRTVNIEKIEESEHPEIADQYDYYYVPTMYVDGKKIYEAHGGESYDECKMHVKEAYEAALAAE